MSPVLKATLLVLFPIGAAVIGSTIAALRPPGVKTTAAIQHLAAGVVFAAVAGEVLPDLRKQSLAAVVIGFSVGVAVLLALRQFSERFETPATPLPRAELVRRGGRRCRSGCSPRSRSTR